MLLVIVRADFECEVRHLYTAMPKDCSALSSSNCVSWLVYFVGACVAAHLADTFLAFASLAFFDFELLGAGGDVFCCGAGLQLRAFSGFSVRICCSKCAVGPIPALKLI